MKTSFLSLIFSLVFSLAFAGTGAYQKAMQTNLEQLRAAKTKAEFQAVANSFERIAANKKTEWLPLYYTAFSYILISQDEKGAQAKDAALDKARPFLDQALALAPTETELILLDGLWTMTRLAVQPSARGQQLTGQAMQQFGRALQQDPTNPRAHLLKGQMEYGMAQFFKSSTDTACGHIQKSLILFETQKPANELMPNWGKKSAEGMAKTCGL